MTRALIAKTHPPEYLLHKYWARKPHNIIRHYIDQYFKEGDKLCDPFSGSGVFLAEAKKSNIDSIGFDLNPIASLISDVTVNPPDEIFALEEMSKLLGEIERKWRKQYLFQGQTIRYCVHAVVTRCGECGAAASADVVKKEGRLYSCPNCASRLYFNLEKFIGTKIVQIITTSGTTIERSDENEKDFIEQEKNSSDHLMRQTYNSNLLLNRRILVFPNMKVSDLFTPRSFALATGLFDKAHAIHDQKTKEAILLFLSSSLAQFSKLIPYRNNLTSGGPAWTVPGFWIAPLHLETNPLIHLKARSRKFIKGVSSLIKEYRSSTAHAEVKNISAQEGMKTLKDGSLDGVFFDPPYGDNVPYLEFSALWNSFLKKKLRYESEIIVSDRVEYKSKWEDYERRLEDAVGLIAKKLKPSGKVIMTFNNLDPRAWDVVLGAFRKHGLTCNEIDYQLPAVVSSKAQFASNSSYIGDFYCVFIKDREIKQNKGGNILVGRLLPVFLSRDGRVPKNLVHRTAILTIVREHLDPKYFYQIDDLVYGIATEEDNYFTLRPELQQKYANKMQKESIKTILERVAIDMLSEGRLDTQIFYSRVLKETQRVGPPPLMEVAKYLEGTVLIKRDYCYLQSPVKQLRLIKIPA